MLIPLLSSLRDNSPVHIPTQFMIFHTLWWLIVKYIQIYRLNYYNYGDDKSCEYEKDLFIFFNNMT